MRRSLTLLTALAFGVAPALAFAAPNTTTQQQDQTDAPTQPRGNAAGASNAAIPDATIGKAGAALRDVANLQQKYQGQFESASPQQKQSLSERANAEAVQAIQSHGISVQEYSNVMRMAQTDPQIKQRLLNVANNQQ